MKVIDNVNETWGDDLRSNLKVGATVRIAAATFSLFAFEALKAELEQVDELQFLFTSAGFTSKPTTPAQARERRQFFIPPPGAESSLYGTEFEIRLRNKMTQRAIARECADWIRRKATFRSNTTGRRAQAFASVDEALLYTGFEGFTTADLGYERGDSLTTYVTKLDEPAVTAQWLGTFHQMWTDDARFPDVTVEVCNHIAAVYAENSPARIYHFILHSVFADFLQDISEDTLPNDRTGYLDTLVWQKLFTFQRDAAVGIINKLETYNGCILADSVGLGKTFTALAVIKYYELRNKSVLVLCPKKLAENWTKYHHNVRTNIFAADRFRYDVLNHTDLSRTRGTSHGIPLDQLQWGNYDLVVIDESHNFRNADYAEEKESRYQRLLREVIREGVQTKVLMLSATPVNNRFNDLRNQLQLAYEGESANLAQHLNLSTSVEKVFADAQKVFSEWSKLDADERTTDRILQMLDLDFFTLLDAVTIARSRRHIETFYDMGEVGTFPTRRAPIAIREGLSDLPAVPSFDAIFHQLEALNLSVYTPMAYVLGSRRRKYEDLYNVKSGTARNNLGQAGRERGLQRLMTTNLLKRLESSVEAFRLTLEKILTSVDTTLARLSMHSGTIDSSDLDIDLLGEDDDSNELLVGEKISIDLRDLDIHSWERDLRHDHETLRALLEVVTPVTAEHDRKFQHLVHLVDSKLAEPFNPANRKVLIFSAFADTANYLYRELAPALEQRGVHCGLITGGSSGARSTVGTGFDAEQIMAMFSPRAKLRNTSMPDITDDIEVLIATDVISEGQNLQDCDLLVNYDIHWNPVRIIQRFGRIDRIGSPNETIQMVNFWPDISLDEYINLKERVESRMVIADLAGTADDNVLTLESSNARFRREQLRKLRDEVIDLEDVRTGVSITDLGLNDFRMDLLSYLTEHPDLAQMPRGLHAVIPADPARGLVPGAIFALRSLVADGAARGNRLHPYYLVYVADDGSPVADQTKAKRVLDLLRAGCAAADEPIPRVLQPFNARTRDGLDMGAYSQLLTAAVHTMAEVSAQRDVDSLFAGGTTTALAGGVKGIDDVELLAFVAVVDPADGDTP